MPNQTSIECPNNSSNSSDARTSLHPFLRSPCTSRPPTPTPSGRSRPAARSSSRSSQRHLIGVSYLRPARRPGRLNLGRHASQQSFLGGETRATGACGQRDWICQPMGRISEAGGRSRRCRRPASPAQSHRCCWMCEPAAAEPSGSPGARREGSVRFGVQTAAQIRSRPRRPIWLLQRGHPGLLGSLLVARGRSARSDRGRPIRADFPQLVLRPRPARPASASSGPSAAGVRRRSTRCGCRRRTRRP